MNAPRRFENLLVATDFSAGADAAIARVRCLPLSENATVHLVHVLPADLPPKLAPVRERAAAELARSTRALGAPLEGRPSPAPRPVPVLLRGEPFVELIRYARTHALELVVLGRHGERGVREHFIGSTAERIVRKGELPLLLVHARPSGPYARPLVAVDLSDASAAVVALALALLPEPAGRLPLLHAYAAPFESSLSRSWAEDVLLQYRRECEQEARAKAERLVSDLGPLAAEPEILLHLGEPRIVVAGELLRRGTDLLVLGTHGRSGLAHALLGSVAEGLIRSSPCDVAITRPARFTFELP